SVVADSAQFSACVTELGDPQYLGTALTIQTCLGFLLTIVSIKLIPRFVDVVGWRYAFMILAPGPLFGVIAMLRLRALPEAVKIVTADLFRKYRRPEDYLKVPAVELQQDVRTTGFFRNKTKSIQGACKMLVEEFGGEVPRTMDELLRLPGVARKTANVVLGVAYGIAAGVVVDTHVSRLSHRLGLTKQKDAPKIETDLLELVPKKDWIIFSHLL